MIDFNLPMNLGLPPVSLPLAGFNFWDYDFWFRESASVNSAQVDWLYMAIMWICVFFFVLIVGLMIVFLARYHARPGHREEHTEHHNNTLEAAWSIFPGMITVWIFGMGFIGYLDLRTPPEGAYEVRVIAKKWAWAFQYPNGHIDDKLHVPIDREVKLVMSSDDVLHSLYIPAFRVKMDVVPGRYSEMWFKATKVAPEVSTDVSKYALQDESGQLIEQPFSSSWEDEGGFDLFCTEYCGTGHSSMLTKVIVHESGTFETWLEKAIQWDPQESPAARGETLYKKRGCSACHSKDGKAGTGPSFKGIFGEEHEIVGQSPVKVDENYIRESILNPMAKIRKGYKGVMPSFQGQVKDRDIDALIYFIKSLKEGEDVPDTWTEIGGIPGAEQEEGAEGEAAAEDESTDAPAEAAEAATEAEPEAEATDDAA